MLWSNIWKFQKMKELWSDLYIWRIGSITLKNNEMLSKKSSDPNALLKFCLRTYFVDKIAFFLLIDRLPFDFLSLDLLTLLRNLSFNNFRKSWYKKIGAYRVWPFAIAQCPVPLQVMIESFAQCGRAWSKRLTFDGDGRFLGPVRIPFSGFLGKHDSRAAFWKSPKIIDFIWYFLHNHYTWLWLIALFIMLYRIWFSAISEFLKWNLF